MGIPDFIYCELLRPKPLKALANGVLRSMIPKTVRIHGATVVLNPTDPVVSGALMLRLYERGETRFFRRVYRPGMTFLDIGANVGYYTALALQISNGDGRVIALEPEPVSFEYLTHTVAKNGGSNVICLRKAAGRQRSQQTLYISQDNRGDNRLYPHEFHTDTCRVDVVPVDELLDELGVPSVDVIKMDVQGYEGHVIAGMLSTIKTSARLAVLLEFWPTGLRRAGSDPCAVLRALKDCGLTLFELAAEAHVIPVRDDVALVERLSGRRYTNLAAAKGVDLAA